MKKFKEIKAFITASAIALTLLLPTTTNAQTRMDGFFASSSATEDYNDRGNYCGDVNNQTFGQSFGIMGGGFQHNTTPVGSGLIIMTLAGASYALLKKKED